MGKNRNIKIIGKLLGGMVAHKILEKYTNKKESINHLRAEIDNYRDNLSFYAGGYNWNSVDKQSIKKGALNSLKSELRKPHFNDVKFPIEEAEKLIDITLNEIM